MAYAKYRGIKLGVDEYDLVEEQAKNARGGQMARSWQYTLKARPSKRPLQYQ